MKKLLLPLLFLLACDYTQSISIYKDDVLVSEVSQIPLKDTSIQVGDYFVTFRIEKEELIGNVSSMANENIGVFKSYNSVKVYFKKTGEIEIKTTTV